MRYVLAVVLIALFALAVTPVRAQLTGCPPGFELGPGTAMDHNGDGYVCTKLPRSDKPTEHIGIIVDNNVPVREKIREP